MEGLNQWISPVSHIILPHTAATQRLEDKEVFRLTHSTQLNKRFLPEGNYFDLPFDDSLLSHLQHFSHLKSEHLLPTE